MSDNPDRKLLVKLLSIVGYQDDLEQGANEFLNLIKDQAILDLVQSLPAEEQEKYKEIKTSDFDPEKASQMIQSHFSAEDIQTALNNASKSIITDYLNTIDASLSLKQKQALQDLGLESVQRHGE